MRYVAFIHGGDGPGFGISFPDCVSDGDTVEETIQRGAAALAFHVEGMIEDGEAVPEPRAIGEIKADPSLAEWREGSDLAFVPLVLDKGSPARNLVPSR